MKITNVLAHPVDRIVNNSKVCRQNIGAQTPLNYVSHKPHFILKVPQKLSRISKKYPHDAFLRVRK